jgi:adenylylsulfate kinase
VRRGIRVEILDGDVVRQTISHGLGFSREDRNENVRRVGIAADHLSQQGIVVFAALISPYGAARDAVRARVGSFIEVFVNAPLEVCERRDPKGLYRKARNGELRAFTGISDVYEPPRAPEVVCYTDRESPEASTRKVVAGILREIRRRPMYAKHSPGSARSERPGSAVIQERG